MHALLKNIIEFLFPRREDVRTLAYLTPENIIEQYAPCAFEHIVALSVFSKKEIRALIHEAKFHENEHAWKILGALFAHHYHTFPQKPDIIIPIPLGKKRMRTRGHNQVLSVLKHINLELPLRADVLIRVHDTKEQTRLGRNDRIKNLHNAFSVTKPELVHEKHVLLVDDVVTTGSTLHTARKELLKHHPASVTCIAFAH